MILFKINIVCFRISIKFNINHSVSEEETEGADKVMLRSKPDFEIDVTRGDIILGFNCSFASGFDSTELDEAANGTYKHNCILLSLLLY